jgi:hypothetical protein
VTEEVTGEVRLDNPPPWIAAIEKWGDWEEEHGAYAEYASWEAWMNSQEVLQGISGSDIMEQFDSLGKVALYVLMQRSRE